MTRWKKLGQKILATTLLTGLVLTIIPFDQIVRVHLENRFPFPSSLPERVDGVIALGGAIHPGISNNRQAVALQGSVERIFGLARLGKLYPEAKLVYTGGSGSITEQGLKEADYAANTLSELGIPSARVIFENQSRNTYENAIYSKELVGPEVSENWILVTSAQHMPRAIGSFRKAGWHIIAYPVDYTVNANVKFQFSLNFATRLNYLAYGLHEVVGLIAYWITGKTNSLYPAPIEQAEI